MKGESKAGSTPSAVGWDAAVESQRGVDSIEIDLAAPGHRWWRPAEQFQYRHYLDLGFVEAHPGEVIPAYQEWDDRAVFHVAHVGHDVIGTIRTIPGEIDSLPSGHGFGVDRERMPGRLVEFASLVVDPSQFGSGVADELYGSAVRWALRRRMDGIVAVVDPWLFELMRDLYRVPFVALGQPRPYMGGSPLPIGVSIQELLRTLPVENPALWAILSRGIEEELLASITCTEA